MARASSIPRRRRFPPRRAADDESTAVGVASLANGYASLAGVLDALDVGLEEAEAFAGWDPR